MLGPPHDRRLIKRSDPSKKHPEVYELVGAEGSHEGFLAAAEALADDGTPETQPFDDYFRIEEAQAQSENGLLKEYYAAGAAWRRIDHDWLGYAGALALALDSDTNNTSLVLAFELTSGGDVILFPGDAQVGNWLSWELLEWQVAEPGGRDGELGRPARAHSALQGRAPRQPQRDLAREGPGADGEQRARRDDPGQPRDSGEDGLADAVPAPADAAGGKDTRPGHGRGARTRRRGAPDLSDTAWKQFVARTDVQPGWIDYTLNGSPQ